MDMAAIYAKLRNGDPLTDEEVLYGYKKFRELAKLLREFGDVFYLGHGEACRRAAELASYWTARTGKILK